MNELDQAFGVLCARLGRDAATSEESDTCTLRAAAKAMVAFAAQPAIPTPVILSGGCTVSAWQPIATAPLDGTFVLLAGLHPNHGWVQKVGTFFAECWWSNGHRVYPVMTHWMPLPDAPVSL